MGDGREIGGKEGEERRDDVGLTYFS